jgi:uncharacterized membrane protein YfcA
MSEIIVIALICSGILVGFINTLAGGGTIISLSLLMFLGLPATVANGTNRIAVLFQNIVAVANFRKNNTLELKKGLSLTIPTILGSVAGAGIAVKLNENIVEIAIAIIMLCLLFIMLLRPKQWLEGNLKRYLQKPTWKTYILFFIIGLYGGFIHVGVGYFILATLVLHSGFNLVKANVVKNLLVLCYIPFTLIIFIWNGQVYWTYGLIHAIGNIIGAYIASKYAVKWGSEFVRWVVIIVISITVAHIFNLIQIDELIHLIFVNE